MSSEAQTFASTVLAAFRAAGNYTDEEVGDAGGPSTTTMTKLRKAAEGTAELTPPRGDTFRNIDSAAGWPKGTARAFWHEGIEPPKASFKTLPSDDAATRLRKIAEAQLAELHRKAWAEADAVAVANPLLAESIRQEAQRVVNEMRTAVDDVVESGFRTDFDLAADNTDDVDREAEAEDTP